MATKTWLGGGNNRASNARDWQGGIAPKPGDYLQIPTGAGGPVTMNIQGNDLAGDTVVLGAYFSIPVSFTANLSAHAVASFTQYTANTTFNVSGNSSLYLAVTAGAHVGNSTATINLYGDGLYNPHENLWLSNEDAQVTVNLLQGAHWDGTLQMGNWFGMTYGRTTVNGAPGTVWQNNGGANKGLRLADGASGPRNFMIASTVIRFLI